jgi:hypothetical protein
MLAGMGSLPRRRGFRCSIGGVFAMVVICGFVGAGIPASTAMAAPRGHSSALPAVRDWVATSKGVQPPGGGAMAYDPRRHQTVLFNGDTWVFEGGSQRWSEKSPTRSPDLLGASAAYDPDTGTIVLFGSEAVDPCDQGASETWTWDGTNWTRQHPAVSPDGCAGFEPTTMAYDARRHRVVMLAAHRGDDTEREVWTWDGKSWTDVNNAGPAGAAIAYDAASSRVMSFGRTFYFRGWNDFGDTEAWNGSSWSTIAAGGGQHDPSPRGFASMTFDPTLNSMVFFGGVSHYRDPQLQSDTWRWTGTHWTRIVTQHSPPPMAGASFAYDTDHHIGVLVGNDGKTWLFTAARGGNGYLLCGSDGSIFTFGDAHSYGSTGNIHLNQPIVGMAATPSGHGYWLVAADGGIFSFGDAHFYGSTGNIHLNQPIVGMTRTPNGHGYYLVARDGGIFAFGDAHFQGSMGATPLNQPIVGMSVDPATRGYWEVAADGGIFSFNAPFYGGTANIHLNQPIVGIASDPAAGGYWLVARDGGVFAFGHARFHGTVNPARPSVAIVTSPTGAGYWIVGSDGHVQAFGDAQPHGDALGEIHSPIVGATST